MGPVELVAVGRPPLRALAVRCLVFPRWGRPGAIAHRVVGQARGRYDVVHRVYRREAALMIPTLLVRALVRAVRLCQRTIVSVRYRQRPRRIELCIIRVWRLGSSVAARYCRYAPRDIVGRAASAVGNTSEGCLLSSALTRGIILGLSPYLCGLYDPVAFSWPLAPEGNGSWYTTGLFFKCQLALVLPGNKKKTKSLIAPAPSRSPRSFGASVGVIRLRHVLCPNPWMGIRVSDG